MEKTYYTAKEVAAILKKSLRTVYRDAQNKDLPSVGKRPNIRFPKDAIDAIAELETEEENNKIRFVKSTVADAWTKQEIVKELFRKGDEPYDESELVPFKTVLEWRKRNNDIGMHVEENGKILGWTTFLPLDEDILISLINDEISEKDIPTARIKKWTDKDISVYIAVIEVVPTGDKKRDKEIGAFLIRNTIKWAISLIVQHDIKNWYGLAMSDEGDKLMKKLGFKSVNGKGEYKGYVLQCNSKKSGVIANVLERMERENSD